METEQLEKEELEKALKDSLKHNEELKTINSKLAHCVSIFSQFHLTAKEKEKIAQMFDSARDQDEITKVHNREVNEIGGPYPHEDVDFRWSPIFSRDILKYYVQVKGYNPMGEIQHHVEPLEKHFQILSEIKTEKNAVKLDKMNIALISNENVARESLKHIKEIINGQTY